MAASSRIADTVQVDPNGDTTVIQGRQEASSMPPLFWPDHKRLDRIKYLFPKPRGLARSDGRTVLCGIIHVMRNSLRRRDAPAEYGPHSLRGP